jgi:hypothetical protein
VTGANEKGAPKSPTPKPPAVVASAALTQARGDVRDGVAAIEHFLQVLGSRRVGPRALAGGIPEVLSGCAPLAAALGVLGGAIQAELAPDPEGVEAAAAMLAHAGRRVDELAAALSAQQGASSLDARERLALEAVVRRVATDLGTVVRLADLLGASVTSETTTIDLGDALAQRRARPPAGATPVLTSVDVRVRELSVGDARLVLELLERAVSIVVRAGVATPRVLAELGPDGFPVLTVAPAPDLMKSGASGDALVLDVVLRDELPREADVVRAAAQHAGIALTIAADRRTVTIAL